jgi:uncharacterized protein YkwD
MRAMRKVSQVWSAVRFAVVAAVLFVGLVAPVQAQAASHAEQVLALVNAERRKAGLGPLALSQRCQAQADKRAKEIFQRGRFNHKGAFNGLRGYGWMGENIAKGYRSPAAVVRGWMRSKGHRANILSRRFTHLGVGVCRGCCVQTFGGGRPKIVRRIVRRKRR